MGMRTNFVLVAIVSFVLFAAVSLQAEETMMVESMEEAVQVATPAEEAISEAGMLATTEEKVALLLQKANEFYGSEEFQGAVDLAKYVLDYLDADSQEAKDLLGMAQEKLTEMASEKIEDVTEAVGGMTTGLTDKMEVLGE